MPQCNDYLFIFSVELEAEIRLTVDELMREELKNLKLVCFTTSEYCGIKFIVHIMSLNSYLVNKFMERN